MLRDPKTTADVLDHFREHSAYSSPGRFGRHYSGLPHDLESLCTAIQQLVLHLYWIREETYGITVEGLKAAGRRPCGEFALATVESRLANVLELDGHPLWEPRHAEKRSIGCCRDYALLLTSVLRHRGVPARVRTGVALYFESASSGGALIEDHYVTEHWNAAELRWQLTDPQIDDVQRPAVKRNLDVLDLPRGEFLTGWQLLEGLRAGRVPAGVGFPPVNVGPTYGRNKLFADFESLTGRELPVHVWWGLGEPTSIEPQDGELVNRMVDLLRRIDRDDHEALSEALSLSRSHPRLAMPKGYRVPCFSSPLC